MVRSLLVLGLLVAGCAVEPLVSEGRPCAPDAPCGPGTRCDPATRTCTASAPGESGATDLGDPDGAVDLAGEGPAPDAGLTIDVARPPDLKPPPPDPDLQPPPPDLPLPPPTCTQIFGSLPGFILCQETVTSCTFYFQVAATTMTCDVVCGQMGQVCLGSRKDTTNGCAWNEAAACDFVHAMDGICICSR